MKKKNFRVIIGDFIANARYVFLILFLGLSIFCLMNINNVKINDSIISYLPDESETKNGLNIMDKEFGELNTITLMVNDISLEDANNLVEEIKALDHVETVLFDGTEDSYKDKSALYTIELEEIEDEDIKVIKKDIEKVVENKDFDIYSESFENPTDGVDLALVLVIIVIIITLIVNSKTYFEPIIAFIIFGISIILNMGSNFIFGEISYITKSIAVILQLALSIDYVIVFMNQYMKERNDTKDNILAIKKTISKSIPEIFASSLTTITGLLALVFMQLKIGGDIGIVLSKGILCSLLTVILIMPSMLSIFEKIILKLKKKEKPKKASELCHFILQSRRRLLPIFLILVISSIFMINNYNYVYNTNSVKSFRLSENTKALKNIENKFKANNTLVILIPNKDKDYTKELELTNALMDNNHIDSVTSLGGYEISENVYLGTQVNYLELANILSINPEISLNLYKLYANNKQELDKLADINNYKISIINIIYFLNDNMNDIPMTDDMKETVTTYSNLLEESSHLLESDNYSRFILNIDMPIESEETYELVDNIRNITNGYYDDTILVGNTINVMDLKSSFTSDNIIITIITIIFIAIILLATFKSIPITLILILTIEGSILINFALVSLMGKEIFFMSYIVVCAIQMGATIDYAIVIADRYKQVRQKMDKNEAIIQTLEDRLPAVITSGLILLIAGFLIGFISTSSVISSIGLFLGIGTLISLIATIFVLPAILHSLDRFIIKK